MSLREGTGRGGIRDGDPVKNKVLQSKLKEMSDAELDSAYQECFSSPSGQLVLEDMRNRCSVFMPSATGAWDRQGEVYFNEGTRSVVLMIETRMQPENEDTVVP